MCEPCTRRARTDGASSQKITTMPSVFGEVAEEIERLFLEGFDRACEEAVAGPGK